MDKAKARQLHGALLAVLALVLTVSCGEPPAAGGPQRSAHRQAEAVPSTPRSAPHTRTPQAQPTVSGKDVLAAARDVAPGISLGALVFDRRAERATLTVNADEQFPAASVVKLLIAIDALRDSADARAEVTRMLSYSSNSAASALWVAGGGPAILRRTTELIGLRDTAPPPTPGRWGSTLLSARDVLAIYRYILIELPEPERELIVDALAATSVYATDGRYQYFGVPAAFDKPWAVKQGWGKTPEVLMVHSTGLVGHDWRYVIVLLTEHPRPGSSWPSLKRAVTAATRATAPLVT